MERPDPPNAIPRRLELTALAVIVRRYWGSDAVISRFVLPWPADAAGSLTVRAGMYTYPAMENIPVLDVAGHPYADAVEIDLP